MTEWLTVVVIGIGGYLSRLSFIAALAGRGVPDWAGRVLKFVAPSVLAAIVVPAVVAPAGAWDLAPLGNPRLLAAIVAAVVAWRWRSMAAVLAAGVGTLWLVQWVG
jgi:branched-subunit amino acid transport protein